jgi:uncharacterized membrane protein
MLLNQEKLSKTQLIAFSGLMAAVICVATSFIKFPTPIGYIHIGDGFIFLAVALLGYYGVASAAIGSALADLLAGYFIYAPGTFIIKGLMGLIALKYIKDNYSVGRCVVGYLLAEILMVLGYFLYEIPIYGVKAASASVFFNDVQGVIGIIIGAVAVLTVKNRLDAGRKHSAQEKMQKTTSN